MKSVVIDGCFSYTCVLRGCETWLLYFKKRTFITAFRRMVLG